MLFSQSLSPSLMHKNTNLHLRIHNVAIILSWALHYITLSLPFVFATVYHSILMMYCIVTVMRFVIIFYKVYVCMHACIQTYIHKYLRANWSHAKLQSNHHHQQTNTPFFYSIKTVYIYACMHACMHACKSSCKS